MELQIEGRHLKITESMRTHLEDKLGKLDRVNGGIHRLKVILEVEKNLSHRVELICTVAKRHTLFAEGQAEDMYVAIDGAERKLLSELKRYKAKLLTTTRGKQKIALSAGNGPVPAVEEAEEEE